MVWTLILTSHIDITRQLTFWLLSGSLSSKVFPQKSITLTLVLRVVFLSVGWSEQDFYASYSEGMN